MNPNPIVQRWREQPCSYCGAGPGERCKGPNGKPTYEHSARIRKASALRVAADIRMQAKKMTAPDPLPPFGVVQAITQLEEAASSPRGRGWASLRSKIILDYIKGLLHATPSTPRS